MLKKFFSFCGAFVLICFSFYYTDSAVDIIKRNDPIMKEIEKANEELQLEPVNAILQDSYIIPGISGTKINLDKSYEKMKNYGSYHSSLLVFEEVIPSITIQNYYDSYIKSANPKDRKVSLIFTLKNTSYLEELLSILSDENVRATFFLDTTIFSSSIDALRLLKFHFHQIESFGENGKYATSILKEDERRLKNIGKYHLSYCFTEQENNEVLSTCKKEKLHTILPSINDVNYPATAIKRNLENGSIIHLTNNNATMRELKASIQYIYQKGYQIVPLEELLQE